MAILNGDECRSLITCFNNRLLNLIWSSYERDTKESFGMRLVHGKIKTKVLKKHVD